MRDTIKVFAALAIVLALSGCTVMAGVRPFWTLSEADFKEIKAGMTQDEVEKRVGKPLWRMAFPARAEETWSYDYLNYQTHMRSAMDFDARGVLKRMTLEYDMDYYSTVASN